MKSWCIAVALVGLSITPAPATAQDCSADCAQRLLQLTRETSKRLDLLQARIDILYARSSVIVNLWAVTPGVVNGRSVLVAQGWGFGCNGFGPLSDYDLNRVAIVVDGVETGDRVERVARPDVMLWSMAVGYCGLFGGGITPLHSGFNIAIPIDGLLVGDGKPHTFTVRFYDPFGRATDSASITR